MAIYSHSKISTFENCPFQYKLKYIERVPVEIPTTIEAFMGDLVHRTLEKLYKDKKFNKRVTTDILIKHYRELWEKEYSKDILIVKEEFSANNYKKMGEKFISDYYDHYKPFDEMTILGLETQDRMSLPDGNKWHIRIDKLGFVGDIYFVCDYKTNARMKDQEDADSDRQLAMYSIWVKDKFKDAKKVILKWHMLAFDKEVTSERTEKQLKELQEEIMSIIRKIEEATKKDNFPRKQTALCNYCGYQKICPSFKHEVELDKKTVKQFKQDEGVKLVDDFSEIKTKLAELKCQEDESREKLIEYGGQFDIDAISGSNHIAKLKEFEKIVLPEGEDKEKFIKLMKKKGLWEDYVTLNYMKLNAGIIKGSLDDKDIKKQIDIEKAVRLTLSKRKDIE